MIPDCLYRTEMSGDLITLDPDTEVELAYEYYGPFDYEDFLMSVGSAIQEYAVIPEGVELWSAEGPFFDLLGEFQRSAVEDFLREEGVKEHDGCEGYVYRSGPPICLTCLATFMVGAQLVKAAIPIFCNCSISIEPA